jgi:hypothetical protein
MKLNNISRAIRISSVALLSLLSATGAYALGLQNYADNSKLAEGSWRKIIVSETGMQFISNAQLKGLGFSDPSKVNVYGYGGQEQKTKLTAENYIDDLPLLPIVRTSDGIIFYGMNTVKWSLNNNSYVPYVSKQNPYATQSIYFLSDRDANVKDISTVDYRVSDTSFATTTFTERLVHEVDQYAPNNTGAWLFGESFADRPNQDFSFTLTGLQGTTADIAVSFATKTTSASSSFIVSANGKQLESTSSDVIAPVANSEMFMRNTTSYKEITNAAEDLTINIKYTQGGVVYFANLDYINVTYTRKLELNNGSLYFYNNMENGSQTMSVAGCSATTQIWDVTTPYAPVKIEYSLTGNVASFRPSESTPGYREYIAFEPSKISLSPTNGEAVANQNIHSMVVPDMVIISLSEFKDQAERVAELHRTKDNMTVHVVTPEELYNEFSSGSPDVMAFRKALKMWYDRGDFPTSGTTLKYCLLFGRPTYDPRLLTETVQKSGYPRLLTWQSFTGTTQNSSFSTDDYLGFLADNSSIFEEASIPSIQIGIGRFPVRYYSEAKQVVDKLIKYLDEPEYGSWRNRVLMIADDQDNGVHMDQSERLYKNMVSHGNGDNYRYTRLFTDSYEMEMTATGLAYPKAKEDLLKYFDQGIGVVSYIGHANPQQWTHEALLTYSDFLNFSNTRLPIFYTATCEFCRWDADLYSAAEVLWANPTAGAIAMISTNRTVYIAQNGTLTDYVGNEFFKTESDLKARRLGDILKDAKNYYKNDENKLRYVIIGDPALRVTNISQSVRVESINGVDMTADGHTSPVLQANAQYKVSGSIVNNQDEVLTGFNGTVELTLCDAQQVVETYGNGTNGKVVYYNENNNVLFSSKVNVVNGKWDTTIIIPSEIENLYNPALLSLYAYSDKGVEANGYTNDFYIYGMSDSASDDNEGPKINLFALNNEYFKSGDKISADPIVYAKVYDESGINISSVGIGHQLSLCLDGKTYFDDISNYYSATVNDIYSGSITYPLSGLEVGDHTLTISVWDNAGNNTEATIAFTVAAGPKPYINDITTDCNPATSSVTFSIMHDRVQEDSEATVDVFDLSGRKIWSASFSGTPDFEYGSNVTWNLTDGSGNRVPRGIYLYRATLITNDGIEVSQTKKLAVAAK